MKRREFIKYGTILAAMGGLCTSFSGCNILPNNLEQNNNIPFDNRPCLVPFKYCEIDWGGKFYPCCSTFLKNSSKDNLFAKKFSELWQGKYITELRERVLKGDFSMCNRDICMQYKPCSVDDIPSDYLDGPKIIKFNYDFECNYNCITCRDKVIINTPEELELYNNIFLPKILEVSKNIKLVNLSGSGDPLFSRHSRLLIKELVKKYPKIKFNILTNGLLLTEKTLNELGIKNNLHWVLVSVDAVNRETYKNILRVDNFDTVMDNVKLMSEWKKQGKVKKVMINFVVHLMNYKELPEFVKMAQKLDITAMVTTYLPWKTAEYHKKYDEVAVFEPKNKYYKEFVKIMKNPIFQDTEHCLLEPKLQYIADSQVPKTLFFQDIQNF